MNRLLRLCRPSICRRMYANMYQCKFVHILIWKFYFLYMIYFHFTTCVLFFLIRIKFRLIVNIWIKVFLRGINSDSGSKLNFY
jgi:hypothetical protein